ncbi:MAG: hypothetical protein V4679_07610 [Pseudomonadota bacterium]
MGALVAFDVHGTWGTTHVCDSLLKLHLRVLGADFGRQDDINLPLPEGARGTDSAECIRLPLQAGSWHARWGEWGCHQADGNGVLVLRVVEGSLLVYLESEQGHSAVFCEAGEWLALPAGLPFKLDAGEAPALELRVLPAATARRSIQAHAMAARRKALPSHDAFVAALLELTGYAAED